MLLFHTVHTIPNMAPFVLFTFVFHFTVHWSNYLPKTEYDGDPPWRKLPGSSLFPTAGGVKAGQVHKHHLGPQCSHIGSVVGAPHLS